MSAFERRVPLPGAAPKKRRLFARDPELPRLLVAALLIGVVLGAVVWYLGSTRGSDLVEVEHVVSLLALALLIGGVLAAIARAVMLSDLRLAVIMVALAVGWSGGTTLAFRVTPGDTTDGDAALVGLPSDADLAQPGPLPTPNALTGARYGGPARCQWDATHTQLLSVTSRRSFAVGDPPPFPARVRIDPVAGTIAIERVRLDTGAVIATYAGTFTPTSEGTTEVVLRDVVRTVTPGLDSDTTLLLDLMFDLKGWLVFWDCPHFA
jgi:hypothetical protein